MAVFNKIVKFSVVLCILVFAVHCWLNVKSYKFTSNSVANLVKTYNGKLISYYLKLSLALFQEVLFISRSGD